VFQKQLGNICRLSVENEVSSDVSQCGLGITLSKNFPTANLNYMMQMGGN